jgi:hypothetical protein
LILDDQNIQKSNISMLERRRSECPVIIYGNDGGGDSSSAGRLTPLNAKLHSVVGEI